jgi:hypothetical protein
MSTKTVRTITGSLRLIGVTAAVAAGIAGFAPVPTAAATTDVAVVAKQTQLNDPSQVPSHVCEKMIENGHVPLEVVFRHGCIVINDSGPIEGAPIFS